MPHIPEEDEYRFQRNTILGMLLGVGLMSGIVGALFATVVPVSRNVTENKHTVITTEKRIVTTEIDESQGCLGGKVGSVVSITTEKLTFKDGSGWTWNNYIVVELQNGDMVTCFFDDVKGDDIYTKGMRVRFASGRRL